MRKNIKNFVSGVVVSAMLSSMVIPANAATGQLPENFEYAPYSDSLSSSVYTPWLKMVHMTTSTQKANNIVGGENCQQIRSVAVSDDGKVVLAGTDTNGIWKTENAGEYWYNTGSFDYVGTYITDIEFVPGSSTEAYMISESRDTTFYGNDEFGLFKTTDGGKSWNCVISENLIAKMVDEILVFDSSKNLYVALNSGIYKVSQNGTITKLYSMPDDLSIKANSIDISSDGSVIIAAYSDGLYYSTDGGVSFIKSSKFSVAYTSDIHPSNNWWYVSTDNGIYVSKDNASSWSTSGINLSYRKVLHAKFAPLYNNKYRYYVTYNERSNGIWYSDDDGSTWSAPTFNRSGTFDELYKTYYRQGFDFGPDGMMWISAGGMFKSNDNGTTFNWKSSGLSGLNVSDIAIDSDGKMYMAAVDVGTVVSNSAYTSKGNYPTFKIASSEAYQEGDVMEIDEATGDIYLLRDNKILRSQDNGKTYSTLQQCERNQKFIKFFDDKFITNDYCSEDYGDSWKLNATPIDAISDVDNNVWWKVDGYGYDDNVQVSTDGGKNWKVLPASQKSNRGIIIADNFDKDISYLITRYGIVKYNVNGIEATYSFPNETTMCFAQNPDNSNHMMIGTSKEGVGKTAGVYETIDGGKQWYAVNGIPGTRSIMNIEFSAFTNEAFIMSCNGLISYDYNEYENQKVQLSFANGEFGIGIQDGIKLPYGTKITLPACDLDATPGYSFVGWTDGVNTYAVGDEYVVPENDITLTAVWEESGKWICRITADNAAYVTTENSFGGVDYTGIYNQDTNNIKANDGIAVLKRTSGLLYYNLDLNALRGKGFSSAKLKFAVMSTGDSYFMSRLYKVSDASWDVATTTGKNQPECETTAFISRDYKFQDSEYIIPKNVYTYVEYDITDLLSNLSENNYKAGIKIFNSDSDGKGVYVKGPTSDMIPYIEFEGIEDGNQISFVGGESSIGNMEPIVEVFGRTIKLPECKYSKVGYSFVGWTDGTTTYNAGSEYVVPENDITLTAVWEESGKWTYNINKENSAYVLTATAWGSNNMYDYSNKFDTALNNIEANDGIAVVRTGAIQKLFYKLDLSALKGKSFTKATLKVASKRGDGSWLKGNVSKTETSSWEPSTLNASNIPTVLSTPSPVVKTYKDHSQSTYTYLDYDITSLLANISDDDYIVGIEFKNTDGDGEGSFIKGPTTDMPPYIEFEGIEDGNKLSFVGGDDAIGSMDVIEVVAGRTIKLPECKYSKVGYSFVGWTDGVNTYAAGDEYVVPENDITLTAVWEESDKITYNITVDNAAYVTTESSFGGVDYTGIYNQDANNIEANDGVAVLKRTSGLLYYNLDLNALRGKGFSSAKLKFAVMSTGDSYFMSRLYKVSDASWDVATTTGKNQPECETTAFISRDYKFSDSEYIIPKNKYTYVEFDITELLSNLSEDNYRVGIKIFNSDWDGQGVYVKGPSSDMVPYVEFEGITAGNKISFAGGEGTIGNMDAITEAEGRTINLPECKYSKVGYSFVGWTDGTTTYNAGDEYVVPENDITLTAVWEESGKWTYNINKENSAYVVTATAWGSNNMYDYSNKFDTALNNIEANDGIAVVRTGAIQKLFYKLDLRALKGKSFTKATLKVASKRGDGSWLKGNVSKTETSSWEPSTLNASNIPAVLGSPAPVVITYKSHSQSTYTYLDFDITSLLANLSDDDYIVGIEFKNTDGDGEGSFIKGPTTDMPPYIEFEGIEDETVAFCKVLPDGVQAISALENALIRCTSMVDGTIGMSTTPYAALYRQNGQLVQVVKGENVILSNNIENVSVDIDLGKTELKAGDVLKMFVWTTEGLKPISIPISISK